ncbi:unnamed protein product [Didymodactylos carnosus]|uniref:Cystathionine beta-lyase n=1 Tax=Didymodactylos carnosus TaxID=1234261 RepID=A0A814I720_9BILA|nr:unnamed protein product [Didymodactylos carnosus]CAF3791071.1 unnamed protein product [Didymodactylos carnosus]
MSETTPVPVLVADSSCNQKAAAGFNTRLSHEGRAGARTYGFVNPPVSRGSTVLHATIDDRINKYTQKLEQVLIYGRLGAETHYALENMITDIEGGTRTQIVSTGLSAVTTTLLAYLKQGDHLFMSDSVSDDDWKRIRQTSFLYGQYASPDDSWLALRGLRTLAVRLRAQAQAALQVAQWLAKREEILQVLYPPLPGAPGHEIWKRDFTGASSLFGIVFKSHYTVEATHAFVDNLKIFGIGLSWGGFESLVLVSTPVTRSITGNKFGGCIVRIHIGLEDIVDLIADLEHGFAVLKEFTTRTQQEPAS